MLDHQLGRFMNHNIAEYHVPVHADMPDIEVIFVEEHDGVIPLGVKGRRDRQCRHRGCDRQRRLSRDRRARARPSYHHRQGRCTGSELQDDRRHPSFGRPGPRV